MFWAVLLVGELRKVERHWQKKPCHQGKTTTIKGCCCVFFRKRSRWHLTLPDLLEFLATHDATPKKVLEEFRWFVGSWSVKRPGARCQWDSSSSNRPFEQPKRREGVSNEVKLWPSHAAQVSLVFRLGRWCAWTCVRNRFADCWGASIARWKPWKGGWVKVGPVGVGIGEVWATNSEIWKMRVDEATSPSQRGFKPIMAYN